MLVAFGEHERRAAVPYGLNDLLADRSIPSLVVYQELIKRLELDPFVGTCVAAGLKRGWADDDRVFERSCRRLRLGIDSMPHGTALHEDDWMMTVLARHRRGQAQDESRLRPTDDLFEAVRRQMVAFIDDHLPVIADAIVHDIFTDEALNDRHIEQPGRLVAAAANAADRLGREVEKRRQTLDPLVQELAPMHEHQRIDAALGDQPGSDDCLAECRRGGQHTSFVLQHRLGRELLLGSELALKGGMQWLSAETLVADDRANIQVGQHLHEHLPDIRVESRCDVDGPQRNR